MLISERQALYKFLASVGGSQNTSGWAAILRTGDSKNVPIRIVDLLASSCGAIELKYLAQNADANRIYNRVYYSSRTMVPIAGYGQKRTVFTGDSQIDTYAVYPEFYKVQTVRTLARTPQQLIGQMGAASAQPLANGTDTVSWQSGDIIEYDYGRTLTVRSIYIGLLNAGMALEYQDVSTLEWKAAPIGSITRFTDGLNFKARRFRMRCTGANSNYSNFCIFAERGAEFTQNPITHAVLVPLTNLVPNTTDGYIGPQDGDYFGLVLDVGQDIILSHTSTGQYTGTITANTVAIPFADNFVESL